MFFCFYSVGHHIYDTMASHCDPSKDHKVQYQLQVLNIELRVSYIMRKYLKTMTLQKDN